LIFFKEPHKTGNKGRDFFDIAFLLSLIDRPDYNYLELKMGVSNEKQLKERIIEKCNSINMVEMAQDVQPFLFNPRDVQKVLLFPELIKQAKL
jgi:hypothetical protein